MTERSQGTVALDRRRVRHYGVNFADLDRMFPGTYPRMVVRGDGAELIDSHGRRVLDAGNHLGTCVVGHGRSDLAEAIAQQTRALEFASLEAGVSHPYVAALAGELASRVPVDDPIFSFTNSGSEANEIALKIARDYHRRRGEQGRVKVLSRETSYHGSTYAGTTATFIPAFRDPFGPLLPGFVAIPQPFSGFCGKCSFGQECTGHVLEDTEAIIGREGPQTIAAILAEPVSIPGAVKVPPKDYWPGLRELCDRHGILLIADEVVCGFGRTGTMFGCEHWNIRPDIMTMAKGLTSGYVPMGATAVARRVQEVFEEDPLIHVNTYAGHPLACAAALKTMQIIDDEDLVTRAASHEPALRQGLSEVGASLPWPTRESVIGLLGSLEIQLPSSVDAERFRARLWHHSYEQGALVRVTRSAQVVSVFFYPPLTVSADRLGRGLADLRVAAQEVAALTINDDGRSEVE